LRSLRWRTVRRAVIKGGPAEIRIGVRIAGLICCIALVACVGQQEQSLTPPPAANLKGYEDDTSAVIEEQRKVCVQPDLQELFAKKMPCKAEDATREQLSDKSKISSSEKIAFLKWEDISAKSNQKLAGINRQYKFKSGEAVASLIEKGLVDSKKLASDFSNGRISWGEFNKRRKDAYMRYRDDLKRAIAN